MTEASAAAPERGNLSPRRKWLFRLAAATLIPALFFPLLEGGLWLIGYGYPTDFFLPVPDRDTYTTNPRFGYRFFPPEIARKPATCELPAAKAGGTYRIFALGGSAAMGTPDPQFGFARMLEAMLQEQFPDARFEVVNAAMTAINSHVVLPIARDCAKLKPDLFVVYMGNNEVVGPYGAGTVFSSFSPNLGVIRANVFLRTTRTGQLIGNVLTPGEQHTEWKGMEMFLGSRVPADHPRMEKLYTHFEKNLAEICDTGRQAGAEIVVCTVAVNQKDSPPFASMHRTDLAEPDREKWEALYGAGIASASQGEYRAALKSFREAVAIDDRHANLHFHIGRCYLALLNSDDAREHFVLARDVDALRFRADTRINRIIRETARNKAGQAVHLVDAERVFSKAAEHGIPGSELFYEHVHMTPEGNYLLAKAVFASVVEILPEMIRKDAAAPVVAPSPDRCFERIGLTGWDRFDMKTRMAQMQAKPPFTNQFDHEIRQVRRERELAELHEKYRDQILAHWRNEVRKNPKDELARYNCANELMQLGQIDEAIEQYGKVLQSRPDDVPTLTNLGVLLTENGELDEGIRHLEKALAIEPEDAMIHGNLGVALVKYGAYEKAVEHFETAAEIDPEIDLDHFQWGNSLLYLDRPEQAVKQYRKAVETRPQFASAHFNWGGALGRLKRIDEAIEHYRLAVEIDPRHASAHNHLGVLLCGQGEFAPAVFHWEKAIEVEPNNIRVMNDLALLLATCPDGDIRNGPRAIELARQASRAAGDKHPVLLNTLAAAYAEAGRYREAVETATRAMELSKKQEDQSLVAKIARRIELYRAGKPFRQVYGNSTPDGAAQRERTRETD